MREVELIKQSTVPWECVGGGGGGGEIYGKETTSPGGIPGGKYPSSTIGNSREHRWEPIPRSPVLSCQLIDAIFLANDALFNLSHADARMPRVPQFVSPPSPLFLASADRYLARVYFVFSRSSSPTLSFSYLPLPAAISCVVVFP